MPAPASRLTSYPRPLQPAPGKTGDVRFRQVAGRWLVTGDAGAHAQLDAADFEAYIEGRLEKDGPVWTELKDKGLMQQLLSSWSAERLAAMLERSSALERTIIFSDEPPIAALEEELVTIARAAQRRR